MENNEPYDVCSEKDRRRFPILMGFAAIVVLLLGLAVGYVLSFGGSGGGLRAVASIFPAGSASPVSTPSAVSGAKASGEREQPSSGDWIKVTPAEWDFGKVKSTEVVTHSFEIKNAGSGVLKISTITTSCGCTTAKAASMSLKPGESTELIVTYNPGHHSSITPGPARRLIYIDSNDPSAPEIKIPVTAFVVKVGSSPTPTIAAPAVSQAGG